MGNRLLAEALGTFWIVFAGCGSALLAASLPQLGIGVFGIPFAFGLAVVTAVYAVSHISGGHLNPAVSIALMLSRRSPASEAPAYIGAQVIGAIVGGGVLYLIASWAGFCAEVVFAFMFLFIILGATDSSAPQGFAPLTIGLTVALINWAGIPVTNLSLNPARSTGTAIFANAWALQQL